MGEGESYEMVWKAVYRDTFSDFIHPNILLMFYSFNSAGNMIHFEHFTLEHYQSLFQNDHLMSVIFNTIAVALLAASNFYSYWYIWCHCYLLFKK